MHRYFIGQFTSPFILCIAAILMLAVPSFAMAADLSTEQKETARQIESLLKQIETNLKLASDTAGPGNGPLTGSKAKLAAVRLQPARDGLPLVDQRLKLLPADHGDVVALAKRTETNRTAITALQARIDGKTPPPQTPDKPKTDTPGNTPTTPAPAPTTIKLDYRQEESLKNARFYVKEIEGLAAAVEKVVADSKLVEDKNNLDHRLIQRAMNSIALSRQRSESVTTHMKNVPANGTGAAPVADAWKAAMTSIDASDKVLAPIHKQLTDLVNPASYPQFEADFKRLNELARQYGYLDQFQVNRPQAATLAQQLPAAKEEMSRIVKTYLLLIHQKTEQGERLAKMAAYFKEKAGEFTTTADAQKKVLPQEIREHLTQIDRMAEQAVREEKPAFFGGGIEQLLGFADEKLALYTVLAPDESKALVSELDKTRADLKVKQKSLHNAIIAANTLPPDRYKGPDRDKLTALAIETWKKQQPTAQVMMVRIPGESWTRSTLWRYQNTTWYLIDSSKLQAQLMVKHEDDLAVIRPINLYIDHLSGDKLTASSMDDIKDELIPQRLLPQAKVK